MVKRIYKSILLPFLSLAVAFPLFGGITGTISGSISDKETGLALPGAAILVEGTTMGAMADKNGFYIIQNLPAGTYDVSVSMIGYSKFTVKNVRVNVDRITEQNFYLTTIVLPLEEVVVIKNRELIQSDITSSTYFISGSEITEKLPVDSYQDVIGLLPGVVGNHFRGGRETDVVYMLDGLPIQGGLSREISSSFPNSSIVEMMVQTGGFTAEYGQASSGIVNVVTKDGRNKVEGEVKIYSDFIDTGLTGNDNTRRLDFNIGGPLTMGLGGPLINANYFISADLNLSDTPFGDQMRKSFDSPIFQNYNFNSKLSFDIGKSTILTFQGLLSNWRWRKFDPQWELNLSGLAEHRHYSHRLSASLTHTFSPSFFTSLRMANYSYKRTISGDVEQDPPDLIFEDPNDPTSRIVSGAQPWQETTHENVSIVKLDLVGKINSHHFVKTGIDFQSYHLNSSNTRFNALSSLGSIPGITFNKFTDDFEFSPRFFGFYVQDKIEFNGITANLGLRYDIFAPRIKVKEIPQEFQDLRNALRAPASKTRTVQHTPFSPRLGISIPLSDLERLHVNYGWYYQMPPLYYLYTNAEHSINSYLPFVGNLGLEPSKTTSSEFSYKRIVANNLLLVITGFTKQFENLVDTRSFLLSDSLITSETKTVGFTRYTNSARGRASGFEITLQKRFTTAFSGRISYTYMKAKGTSSQAEDRFNLAITGAPPPEEQEFPLSWDQRHSLIMDADFENVKMKINILYRLFSPLPFTTPGSETPNNERLSWRNLLDIKIKLKSLNILQGKLQPFIEVRNLFNEKNIINQIDDSGIRAYRLFDPINSDHGRRLRIGVTLRM
ncbi:MAG: TonB-dependent receptor domain-containing protein [bacterium]